VVVEPGDLEQDLGAVGRELDDAVVALVGDIEVVPRVYGEALRVLKARAVSLVVVMPVLVSMPAVYVHLRHDGPRGSQQDHLVFIGARHPDEPVRADRDAGRVLDLVDDDIRVLATDGEVEDGVAHEDGRGRRGRVADGVGRAQAQGLVAGERCRVPGGEQA
jgi:hypothetical protein